MNNKQVVIDYLNGRTMKEVALLHGIAPSTVGKIVQQSGLYRRGSKLDEHKSQIRALAEAGTPRAAIAKKFDCSINCVETFCKKHKIKLPNGHDKRHPIQKMLDADFELIEAIAPEFTYAELADKWDVDVFVMQSWLQNRGIRSKRMTAINETRGRKKIEMDKGSIVKALNDNAGHIRKSALQLGIARSTLERLIKQHNIKRISDQ